MKNELNSFEIQLLNRILQGGSLNESKSIQIAVRNFISDDKERIMQELSINESEFRAFHLQTVNKLFEFLKSNDFVAEREGGVVFITEKGKNLRRQGSVEKYEAWAKEARAKNKTVLRTIETRGYLDQDEIIRNRRALIFKRVKRFIVYPLLLLILVFFLLLGAHHYNLDKNIPVLKNFFDKNKTEQTDSKQENKKDNIHKNRKKKH